MKRCGTRLRIMSVVGARPNFMKIAPFARELARFPGQFEPLLVHTGQHYDEAMSAAFFRELGIPAPDIDLEIGSGTHAEQVGRTMIAFEKVVQQRRPDWVVVVGDVNATCACAITAKKEHVKLAHIEAGLRSFDLGMPEEINRMVTDRLSDLLFTTDAMADDNLRREGVPDERIRRVGNIMIDTLEQQRPRAAGLDPQHIVERQRLEGVARGPLPALADDGFAVLTLHRPSNVDDRSVLAALVDVLLGEVASRMPLIWPVHPRTRKQLEAFGLWSQVTVCPAVVLTPPLGYLDMLRLTLGARVMLTDSGGLQEECCVAGTPCVTLRLNTERPVTLREHGGVSILVGNDPVRIRAAFLDALAEPRAPHRPPLWDGRAAERMVAYFRDLA
jgi:UDP-N-acetylglucosamine 2-epimerase (non-hydrolysing)